MKKRSPETDMVVRVNASLDDFFVSSIEDARKIDESYARLWQGLHQLIGAGGKRLRPQMLAMAYEAFGGSDIDAIMPVATAQELLHFAMLIHDDIIDRDNIRYGVPNIIGQHKIQYSGSVSSEDDLNHYANSVAILGGDVMLSAAHRMIALCDLPAEKIRLAQAQLSKAVFDVVGGELIDTELSFSTHKNSDALKVALHKTSSYSFVAPLVTGARLANANENDIKHMEKFAVSLGIGFQLADDLLGVFGDEDETGKSTTSDIVEGKHTYLVEMALKLFTPTEQADFSRAFGNHTATPMEVQAAKELLESSGAKAKTEEAIKKYAEDAEASLVKLKLPAEHVQKFTALITKATQRDR